MFLRYLAIEGKCVAGLDEAVPSVANWRLSSLPRYLEASDVERVIASCDARTTLGARNRAILLLLARFGFRAGDVVSLRLRDIDWNQATIWVSGKGRCQSCRLTSAMCISPTRSGA
jgi:integrase